MNQVVKAVCDRYQQLFRDIREGPPAGFDPYRWVFPYQKDLNKLGFANAAALDGSDAVDEKTKSIRFVISELSNDYPEDRDGDCVNPAGIKLHNYSRNPIVFFGHQEWVVPIGKCKDPSGRLTVWPGKTKAKARIFFDPDDSDAQVIFRKCATGYLNCVSCAFVPLVAWRRDFREKARHDLDDHTPLGHWFDEVDLTEVSIVGVPSNAAAIRDDLDREKSFYSPKLRKALEPYAARAKGRGWIGWTPCPCPPGIKCEKGTCVPVEKGFKVGDWVAWKGNDGVVRQGKVTSLYDDGNKLGIKPKGAVQESVISTDSAKSSIAAFGPPKSFPYPVRKELSQKTTEELRGFARDVVEYPGTVPPVKKLMAKVLTETRKYIRHEGSKWVVHAESGKVLGAHDTKESAQRQLAAVEANKHKSIGDRGHLDHDEGPGPDEQAMWVDADMMGQPGFRAGWYVTSRHHGNHPVAGPFRNEAEAQRHVGKSVTKGIVSIRSGEHAGKVARLTFPTGYQPKTFTLEFADGSRTTLPSGNLPKNRPATKQEEQQFRSAGGSAAASGFKVGDKVTYAGDQSTFWNELKPGAAGTVAEVASRGDVMFHVNGGGTFQVDARSLKKGLKMKSGCCGECKAGRPCRGIKKGKKEDVTYSIPNDGLVKFMTLAGGYGLKVLMNQAMGNERYMKVRGEKFGIEGFDNEYGRQFRKKSLRAKSDNQADTESTGKRPAVNPLPGPRPETQKAPSPEQKETYRQLKSIPMHSTTTINGQSVERMDVDYYKWNGMKLTAGELAPYLTPKNKSLNTNLGQKLMKSDTVTVRGRATALLANCDALGVRAEPLGSTPDLSGQTFRLKGDPRRVARLKARFHADTSTDRFLDHPGLIELLGWEKAHRIAARPSATFRAKAQDGSTVRVCQKGDGRYLVTGVRKGDDLKPGDRVILNPDKDVSYQPNLRDLVGQEMEVTRIRGSGVKVRLQNGQERFIDLPFLRKKSLNHSTTKHYLLQLPDGRWYAGLDVRPTPDTSRAVFWKGAAPAKAKAKELKVAWGLSESPRVMMRRKGVVNKAVGRNCLVGDHDLCSLPQCDCPCHSAKKSLSSSSGPAGGYTVPPGSAQADLDDDKVETKAGEKFRVIRTPPGLDGFWVMGNNGTGGGRYSTREDAKRAAEDFNTGKREPPRAYRDPPRVAAGSSGGGICHQGQTQANTNCTPAKTLATAK